MDSRILLFLPKLFLGVIFSWVAYHQIVVPCFLDKILALWAGLGLSVVRGFLEIGASWLLLS
jgi:hypothetical protein